MSKIKITEAQLGKLIKSKNNLDEQWNDAPEMDNHGGSGEFKNIEELLSSVKERLDLALNIKEWNLVDEIAYDMDKFMGSQDEKSPEVKPEETSGFNFADINLNESQILLKKTFDKFTK